jgi:hypothetical protein
MTDCTRHPEVPFRECPNGSLTFPDPTLCCSLTDESDCILTDDDAGFVDAAMGCSSGCAPGTALFPYGLFDYDCDGGPDAFEFEADDATLDFCFCQSSSCCLGLDLEGGPGGDCWPYGFECPPLANAECERCPAGWEAGATFDLCCKTGACGIECFSQASSIAPVFSPGGCAESFFPKASCSCDKFDEEGNVYFVECEDGECTYMQNGVTTGVLGYARFGVPAG